MNQIERKFWPVGHGGFASEKFSDSQGNRIFTAVYDCGSKNRSLVENAIDSAFGENEKIDAVYLSHFDDDHINGLPYLISRCNVKCVYFPFITNAGVVISLAIGSYLHASNPADAVTYQLLSHLTRGLLPEIKGDGVENNWFNADEFLGIKPGNQNDSPDNDNDTWWTCNSCSAVKAKKNISTCNCQWIFDPFNLQKVPRCEECVTLDSCYSRCVTCFNKNASSTTCCGKEIRSCLKRLKTLCDTHMLGGRKNLRNWFSLTLYSGIDNNSNLRMCPDGGSCYCSNGIRIGGSVPCGCLYTGDYKAKTKSKAKTTSAWEQFIDHFGRYSQCVGCVQLPHHGADDNFNDKFLDFKDACYIVSAPAKDKLHPGPKLKNALKSDNRPLIVVDENNAFEFTECKPACCQLKTSAHNLNLANCNAVYGQ